ncbi:Periodic tryptophan protein 2-like protein [Tripterygium wilfordii]|uniref:Periodic tryptophan protein 2-like protein n=1 Tax=Tripterygium wilfordii TaxID=458696 RepID=A0A7J7CYF9_TRIWF|nr:Periodic tryptophan protein 2-like protein [Tripterygium wilfordii]
MNYRFQNLLGASYRGGNAVITQDATLISPVGNRVCVTDLLKSHTLTLPVQASSNVTRIAASPDGTFLLTVDENRRCLFINVPRRAVLHRITFKFPVATLKFSPDGAYIAVATGKLVQIWRSPGFKKEVFAFELVRTLADGEDKVTALEWSPDGNYLLVGSKDLTARLFNVNKVKGVSSKPHLFLGHRDTVIGCFFGVDKKTNRVDKAYTITRDCYIFSWGLSDYSGNGDKIDELRGQNSEPLSPGTPEREAEENLENRGGDNLKKRKIFNDLDGNLREGFLHLGKWELLRKDGFMQAPAKLTACDYHSALDMVVVGFSSGVFGLYQMPDFVCIHLLSISREKITTAVFNRLGNWLAFGCAKLGQLLVWEWRSESYILKQQGHYFDANCVAYSPDSQLLATGADDNKVKVWNAHQVFAF